MILVAVPGGGFQVHCILLPMLAQAKLLQGVLGVANIEHG